ncbi:PTS transporter subunit EIIC [Mycoplasmopsis columboralis]|uniref:EIIBC-Tre n=1 Tax=Mycoplasmopsis columboralis TaxID=171282 RepID=A0A449B6S4_9BACT|nr:PTS transporter subunit EIIC [Mycoplasmopsis columboralis]VEU76311.1 EIIBC-Tre [Mycoplasmopsis columboralis]
MKKKNKISKYFEFFGGIENIKFYHHKDNFYTFYFHDFSDVKIAQIQNYLFLGDIQVFDDFLTIKINEECFKDFKGLLSSKFKFDHNYYKKVFLWDETLKPSKNLINILRNLFKGFADIFLPLIPLFIVGGLSLATAILIDSFSKTTTQHSASYFLKLIGNSIFTSLPIFIGYTSMKRYGGNPFLGMAIGIILVAPSLFNINDSLNKYYVSAQLGASSETISMLKQTFIEEHKNIPNLTLDDIKVSYSLFPTNWGYFKFEFIGYQSQVFPTLIIVYLAYWIERISNKYIHSSIVALLSPLFTVLISVFIGFWILGPLGRVISDILAVALSGIWTYTNFPYFGIGGFIIGFSYPFMVLTGFHQGLLPVEIQLLATIGRSWISPIAISSNIAQGTVALAIATWMFINKFKNKTTKVISSGVTANLGITEPVVFGINLPLKYPMLIAAFSAGVAGYWMGITQVAAISQGSSSWIGSLIQFTWTITDADKQYYESLKLFSMGEYYIVNSIANALKMLIANLIAVLTAFSITLTLSLTKFKAQTKQWVVQNL